MSRSFQPTTVPERANKGLFWRALAAAIGIFVATLAPLMWLDRMPLSQAWIVGLLGLAVLLPHALWLAVVLHSDGWTPRPWRLVMLAIAWGSLVSSTAAILLETASGTIVDRLGIPNLDAMIIGPFWEEVTKGAFIVLLYIFAQKQICGAWNGLFYGVLVGTGFGVTEDLVDLISNLDDFADLASAYMVREVFMAHLHPMFTACTGLAAGIAAQQGVAASRGLRWILYGFLIALTLHAIFDSATVFVTSATLILGPLYAVIAVIALRHLRRQREKAIAQGESA